MLFKRIRNLWKLSEIEVEIPVKDGVRQKISFSRFEDLKVLFPKKKQVLATIIQEKSNPFEL